MCLIWCCVAYCAGRESLTSQSTRALAGRAIWINWTHTSCEAICSKVKVLSDIYITYGKKMKVKFKYNYFLTAKWTSRRESPWKVDGESSGVASKLKVLEEELLTLDKVGKNNLPKVASSMRKQAKRYQDLSGKIDDLCRRMVYDHSYNCYLTLCTYCLNVL